MDTSRIIINTIDNSSYSTETSTAVAGYTVVEAEKGPCRPKKISAGGTAKLKDIFGTSSANYPELFEVETFISGYDCYVSAPYVSATVPVAYVTKDGNILAGKETKSYTAELEDVINGEKEFEDVDTLKSTLVADDKGSVDLLVNTKYARTCGLGEEDVSGNISYIENYKRDGVTTDIASGILINLGMKTLPELPFILKGINPDYNENFTISEGTLGYGVKYNKESQVIGYIVSISEASQSYTIIGKDNNTTDTKYIFIIGEDNSKAFTKSYVSSLKAIHSNISAYWVKSYKATDIKAIILPKYPSKGRALHIGFTPFNSNKDYDSQQYTSRNLLKMSVYEEGAFHNVSHSISITGSLDSSAVTKSGTSVGFNSANEDYANQELVFVHVFEPFKDTETFSAIAQYPSIILDGGTRTFENTSGTKDSIALHNIGWDYAKKEEFQDVSIFFSSEKNMKDSPSSSFFSIASAGPQLAKYSGFIFNETPDEVNESTKILTYGREYWNTCNIAVIDISKGSRIFSPLTGAKALMQARIIDNRYGGLAPMWENVNGMGGQLTMVSPYRMKFKYTKEELSILDSKNYNPVIMDRQYGVMCTGQRTCQSGALTDWSYIGHACAFMTCIKEIRNNVMIPQIGKANNPYYRTLRAEQVNQILRKRIEGNNRIWAEGIVDTSTAEGVNDVYAQKALTFRISCKVKCDIFSEYVELMFFNEDQSSTINIEE